MDLSFILNLIATAAVIVGVVFGLTQLRHYHLSRKRESALLLLNSYQTSEFSRGMWTILSIEDGLTKDEIEEKVGGEISTIYLVMSAWESLGILVFNREVELDMVCDAYSGPVTLSWQKLKPLVTGMREEYTRERIFEWFQWLAERIREHDRVRSQMPA
jgi:hypothetical protein